MNLLSMYLKNLTPLDKRFTVPEAFRHRLRRSFLAVILISGLVTGRAFSAEVDLSVKQTVDKANPQVNDLVKFTVYVKNSGPGTATNIVVENVVPKNGLGSISGVVITGTWNYDTSTGTGLWTIPSLPAGDSLKLEVSGMVIQRGVFFNIAQVKSSPDNDADSTPGNNNLSEDDISTACFSVPILWYRGDTYTVSVPAIYGNMNLKWFNNGTEIGSSDTAATVNPDHTLTIKGPGSFTFTTSQTTCGPTGCCPVVVLKGTTFDLALRKTSITTSVKVNTPITFYVSLFNQGDVKATAIQIADYIPAGLTLADGNWEEKTPGIASLKVPVDTLLPGHVTQKSITFIATGAPNDTLRNAAEISSARDGEGNIAEDIDSTPDDNPNNDGIAKDDVIDENHKKNPADDEDDADFSEFVIVPGDVFDLAARKILTTYGPLYPGMKVTFQYDVFNQGTLNATKVKLVDYIPAGLILEDTAWTQTGNIAFLNDPSFTILQGQVRSKSISFRIDPSYLGTQIINRGEISQAKGPSGEDVTDIDSSPDSDPLNDLVAIDDEILQNGKTGGDEDDADFTIIYINQYTSIGDFVWDDKNRNGLQDPQEPGIPGVSVTLEHANGDSLTTVLTNAQGIYLFDTLLVGDYVVRIQKPTGYDFFTQRYAGSDNTRDSDFDPVTGKSGIITLLSGAKNMTVDAGFYKYVCDEITSVNIADSQICMGDSTLLSAVSLLGAKISFYNVPSGGTPLFSANSGESKLVYPTTSTVYYAVSDSLSPGCTPVRVPVALTVHGRPSNPSSINVIEVCTGLTTNLNSHIINGVTTPGGSFEWHTGPLSGSPLVSNVTTAGPGIYYLFEKSGAGCYSNPAQVRVTAKTCSEIIDLSLIKTADKRVVSLNDTITYTILLANAGPDNATNIVLEDILPAGLTFVSSPDFTHNAGVLTLQLPLLANGGSKTFTYKLKAVRTGTLINIAQVKSADQHDSDSTPGNSSTVNEDDDDDEIIHVTGPSTEMADLRLEKVVSNISPYVNDNITYYIRVTNDGPDTATNVIVEDILPAGLQLVSTSGSDLLTTTGNTIRAKFNRILAHEEVEFRIVVKVTAAGQISNRAEVMASDQPDPDSVPGSGADEDDDDTRTINAIQNCNPSTPVISALNAYLCPGESTTLSAVSCNGTVTWSNGMTGNSITVSPQSSTTYTARCTVGTCESAVSNSVNISVGGVAPPSVTASSNAICSGQAVTLTATGCAGTVRWSNNVLGSSIVVTQTQNTTYTAVCIVGNCQSNPSSALTITITTSIIAPVISADKQSICVGDTVTLTATQCTGTVTWSNGMTGPSVKVSPASNTAYTATCGSGTCLSPNSNTVNITTGTSQGTPVITASTNATCGGQAVTLSVSNCSAGILWSNNQTTSTITVTPNTTTTYSVSCGSGACKTTASKIITVGGLGETPVITASQTAVCKGAPVTLTAGSCSGTITWSNGGTGNSITVTSDSTKTYTATCNTGTQCKGFASTTITVSPIPQAPIVTAGKDTVCAGEPVTLTASNCSGTVRWSGQQTGTTLTVNPEETASYTATCVVNGCSSSSSVAKTIVVRGNKPVITASKEVLCDTSSSAVLTVSNCQGTILWNNGATTASITVKPAITTTYTVSCLNSGCVGTATKTITRTIPVKPIVNPSVSNACPVQTVSLLNAVTSLPSAGGKFIFRTGDSPQSPRVLNPAAVSASGTYYAFDSTASGCISPAAAIQVNISTCGTLPDCTAQPATAYAGKDSLFCPQGSGFFTLNGQIGGAASAGTWTSTNGSGGFSNVAGLSARYHYTQQDLTRGHVTFVLTTNDPDGTGSCTAARDSMTLTFNAPDKRPFVTFNKMPLLCYGDSLTLTVEDNSGFRVLWNTGDTTKTIRVRNAGSYWAKFVSASGCSSLNSDTVNVSVKPQIAAPLVSLLASNACPAVTVNLTEKVLSQPLTPGGVFEYRTGISPASPLVTLPFAVGAGSYVVFEKTTEGCFSQPALINVTIGSCNGVNPAADSADVQVTLTGNKTIADIGDEVVYTLTVRNNGPKTAVSVKVVNTLPVQLQVNNAPELSRSGSTLNDTIPVLATGQSKVYTYTGKIVQPGLTSNFVQITPMGNFDPVLSNNSSRFDVQCITCPDTCIATALKADTVLQLDGSYNIRFTSQIRNCGTVDLENVNIIHRLDTVFTAPVSFRVIQLPLVTSSNSQLAINTHFNGKTETGLLNPSLSKLKAGKTDTVVYVINVIPNGVFGPFFTNSKAIGSTAAPVDSVSDISNDGIIINKPSSSSTVIRLQNSPGIGLALAIIDTVKNINGTYDVIYQAIVKNTGSMRLDSVIVSDTLSKAFRSPSSFSIVSAPVSNSGSELVTNPDFDGNADPRLTLSGGKLGIGKTDTLRYTIRIQPDTLKRFETQAIAYGYGSTDPVRVKDLSNDGTDPDRPGEAPTVLLLDNSGLNPGACIGLALYIADTTFLPDGSYHVIYHAIVKNCGTLALNNVSICDTLSTTFTGATVAIIAGPPSVGSGSTIVPDPSFNGVSNFCLLNAAASTLAPGKTDTLKWTVKVILNGNNGPFLNNVTVFAQTSEGQNISDMSNDGTNPDPAGSYPTIINFNSGQGDAMIGIAKKLNDIIPVEGRPYVFDLPFTFVLKNYGIKDFERVQIQDNLSAYFGDKVVIDSVAITGLSNGLTANTEFTGKGDLINLLIDSLSSLPVKSSAYVNLLVRVNMEFADTTRFTNSALAIGFYEGTSTDDVSADGDNPDKNLNGWPIDDSDPTIIDFGNIIVPPVFTPIGVAKAVVVDSNANADGSYNATFTVIVKNFGTVALDSVQLTDTLDVVFANRTTYSLMDSVTLNEGSQLVLNPLFGKNDSTGYHLLSPVGSILAPGASDTLTFRLKIRNNSPETQIYLNTITATARDSSGVVSDTSDSGFDPDDNGNGNPSDDNDPTEVIIPSSGSDTLAITLFISDGISPNNDGLNEKLIIKDLNNPEAITEADQITVYIYNRWGQMVFKSENYKKDFPGDNNGWDGATNTGIGNKGAVPDGTYYYVMESPSVRIFGGKRYVNFITVAR